MTNGAQTYYSRKAHDRTVLDEIIERCLQPREAVKGGVIDSEVPRLHPWFKTEVGEEQR